MDRRTHSHSASQVAARRRGLIGLAAIAGLVVLVGGNATLAAADPGASQVVRAGAKAIGHASKPSGSGLLSLHSSQATGVITPTPAVYLVFWGSQWNTPSGDPAGAQTALTDLFGNLYGSADNWGTILTQYCEGVPSGTTSCGTSGTHVTHPGSSVLKGVWDDGAAPAPVKATTSQIAAEAVNAVAYFRAHSSAPDLLNAQFVIASPSGTHPDGFPHGFCGWHSSTTSSSGNVAYTNLPYVPDLPAASCTTLANPGPLDGYESTETHEYAESVTDPFPSSGWLKGGAEIGDLCINQDAHLTLSNGATYDVQGLWSNAANAGTGACVTSG